MKPSILDQPLPPAGSAAFAGWLRAALTLCLLGLPVVLGYFACQMQAARHAEYFQDKAAQAWMDLPAGQALAAPGAARLAVPFLSLDEPRLKAALARLIDLPGLPRAAFSRVPVSRHKHGRVMDPATYLRHTRC